MPKAPKLTLIEQDFLKYKGMNPCHRVAARKPKPANYAWIPRPDPIYPPCGPAEAKRRWLKRNEDIARARREKAERIANQKPREVPCPNAFKGPLAGRYN